MYGSTEGHTETCYLLVSFAFSWIFLSNSFYGPSLKLDGISQGVYKEFTTHISFALFFESGNCIEICKSYKTCINNVGTFFCP